MDPVPQDAHRRHTNNATQQFRAHWWYPSFKILHYQQVLCTLYVCGNFRKHPKKQSYVYFLLWFYLEIIMIEVEWYVLFFMLHGTCPLFLWWISYPRWKLKGDCTSMACVGMTCQGLPVRVTQIKLSLHLQSMTLKYKWTGPKGEWLASRSSHITASEKSYTFHWKGN